MTDQTTNPLLALPGAVQGTGRDAGVAAHYGNPLLEQRRLAAGEAFVDLSHHAVLTITGPDRLTWLDSMSSQSLKSLRPGDSAETLLLAPTGRLEYALKLIDDGELLWVLVERQEAAGLLAWLDSMRFMLRVELADRSDEFATIGSFAELPVAATTSWRDPWASVVAGGHQYAAPDEHPAAGWSWRETLIPREALGDLAGRVSAGEASAAGLLAFEALRIAAWRPRFATEVDERTIPHELDWLRTAVHLNKGCYRGQETIAKVHNLGHPPRRLVMLHLDGSEGVLPPAGSEVWLERDGERRGVGTVTSSAIHYELGPIALAVIKRTTDAAATLFIDADDVTVAAAQQPIVPPTAGAEANVPRLPRLGAVTRPPR
ncbi:folate-binding protein [Microbacterium sp. STN6]|uniref:CAF17-like 4Fe-4S cluster assembly/insertion protein YgfZ n=1 Tax=Microbacterium sp. STN6 TaxID=2995588 RepID=UPI002260DEE7|nr:glycine cleavage T C-terminal barrel domain-containing protein [Microbacterium sp. STN6]MCX7523381.1 folate-binding protein [Microbacterium sp. STN6]